MILRYRGWKDSWLFKILGLGTSDIRRFDRASGSGTKLLMLANVAGVSGYARFATRKRAQVFPDFG
jgi:hypothetical protein